MRGIPTFGGFGIGWRGIFVLNGSSIPSDFAFLPYGICSIWCPRSVLGSGFVCRSRSPYVVAGQTGRMPVGGAVRGASVCGCGRVVDGCAGSSTVCCAQFVVAAGVSAGRYGLFVRSADVVIGCRSGKKPFRVFWQKPLRALATDFVVGFKLVRFKPTQNWWGLHPRNRRGLHPCDWVTKKCIRVFTRLRELKLRQMS